MVAFGAVVVFVVVVLLEILRMAVMLFRILDDVFKPEWVLFNLRRVFLRVPVDLFADIARRIFVLAVNEFQVIGCEVLRKIELGRFELDERRLCGESSAFGPRHFEVGRWAARNGFCGKMRKQQDVERWNFIMMSFAAGTPKKNRQINHTSSDSKPRILILRRQTSMCHSPGMENVSALNYDSRSLDNFTTWFKMEISPLREMAQINFSVHIGAFVKPHHFFDVRK